jgi:hypothetical protein
MRKLLFAFVALLAWTAASFAACTASVPAGSFQMEACNQGNLLTESPYATISDASALPLGFYMAWSNASTALLNGVPVSFPVTFTSGNPSISAPGHGLAAGSYIVLSTTAPNSTTVGTLPGNFTGSTLTSQTVEYVIAAGLTTSAFELSATPGGSATIPNANGTGYAFNLVAGYDAWFNALIVQLKTQQQQAATAQPTVPAQIPIVPAQ